MYYFFASAARKKDRLAFILLSSSYNITGPITITKYAALYENKKAAGALQILFTPAAQRR